MASAGDGSVLIVEDEQELRGLFALLLELEGFTVYQANDGKQGLEVLKAHAGDIGLLITDLNLPKLAGVDLIGHARTLNPAVKIVGTSGMSGSAVRDMVLKAGADEFLPKPFQPQDAIRRLKAMLGQP
ncbi:MAG: response regulator [Bacteroidetes bacterium]|nr:response regulator [Bacteroidota bacterium]